MDISSAATNPSSSWLLHLRSPLRTYLHGVPVYDLFDLFKVPDDISRTVPEKIRCFALEILPQGLAFCGHNRHRKAGLP